MYRYNLVRIWTTFRLSAEQTGGVPPSGVRVEGVGFTVVALQGHHFLADWDHPSYYWPNHILYCWRCHG